MSDKNSDEQHNLYYVGETIRSLLKRMLEGYPPGFELYGVTDRIQVGQAGESTLDWTAKTRVLLIESTIATMLEATSNKAASKKYGETYKPLPYYKQSCGNKLPCGTGFLQKSRNGIMQFMKGNCSVNGDRLVCDMTTDPGILRFCNQFSYLITRCAGKVDREDYKPTVRELCVAWGTMMYELGKGAFDKGKTPIALTDYVKDGKVVVRAGDHYDNWGQYAHHTNQGLMKTKKLLHMAVVIEKQYHLDDISELKSLEDVSFEEESDEYNKFELLRKELGNDLLKKMKDAREDYNKSKSKDELSFRHIAAELHHRCGDYANLDSFEGITFAEDTDKMFKALSIKYEDDEMLTKLKVIHNKKWNATITFVLDLNSEKSAGIGMAAFNNNSIRISNIASNTLASEAVSIDGTKRILTINMEVKSINDKSVDGVGVT